MIDFIGLFDRFCEFSSDFDCIHVEIFGSFRCSLKNCFFERIFRNEFRYFDECGKRNDVEGDEFALFVVCRRGDRKFYDCVLVVFGNIDIVAVNEDKAAFLEVGKVFVGSFLRKAEHEVDISRFRVFYGFVADDDVSFRRAASRLRAVGLALNSVFVLVKSRCGSQNNGCKDYALTAAA